MESSLTRIAIVSADKCKPKKCKQECKKYCPVVKIGKLCIEVTSESKISHISEELCIGCGICTKKCPFDAIKIVNLPGGLAKDTVHRYGPNAFKLHRLPTPRPGKVLGLVGSNGIGKSTALKLIAGKLKPNLGLLDAKPDWPEIITHFRGSELQNYFTKLRENNLKTAIKPQYVDNIPKEIHGTIREIVEQKNERNLKDYFLDQLGLSQIADRNLEQLSGGELQRLAVAVVCMRAADIYMFDEPSSYLDIKQRLVVAQAIRSLLIPTNYVIVVEHDLSVLDYLSDFICVLYGSPGVYGVITLPYSIKEGINIFLDGFIPTENLRFRSETLTFRISDVIDEDIKKHSCYQYPNMTKTLDHFKLTICAGEFTDSEIIVMLGQNGTGKTTFVKMLAGILKSDNDDQIPKLNVSYKPQKISPKFEGTVRQLLHLKIKDAYLHPQFMSDVTKPLMIEQIIDQEVQTLSGGELQRVALCLCLGQPADVWRCEASPDHRLIWTVSKESFVPELLRGLSCTPEKQLLLLNMTSSWQLIWLTKLLFMKENPQLIV